MFCGGYSNRVKRLRRLSGNFTWKLLSLTKAYKLALLPFVVNISSNLCVCEQPIRRQNLFVRWLLNGVIETICSVLKILRSLWGEIPLLSKHIAKNLLRAVKRLVMRIIVLPQCKWEEVRRKRKWFAVCGFEGTEYGGFTECTTPSLYANSPRLFFRFVIQDNKVLPRWGPSGIINMCMWLDV